MTALSILTLYSNTCLSRPIYSLESKIELILSMVNLISYFEFKKNRSHITRLFLQ